MAKVNLVFSAPPTGIISLERAVAQWEEKYMAPAPKTTTTTTTAATATGASASTTTAPTEATTTTTEEPKMVEMIRKHTMKCKLTVKETLPRPMTVEEIEEAKTRLAEFEAVDAMALRLAKARNRST